MPSFKLSDKASTSSRYASHLEVVSTTSANFVLSGKPGIRCDAKLSITFYASTSYHQNIGPRYSTGTEYSVQVDHCGASGCAAAGAGYFPVPYHVSYYLDFNHALRGRCLGVRLLRNTNG